MLQFKLGYKGGPAVVTFSWWTQSADVPTKGTALWFTVEANLISRTVTVHYELVQLFLQ
jgi:hypothetical protein